MICADGNVLGLRVVQVAKALDALLEGLSVVASKAADELGAGATEEQIASHAVKLPSDGDRSSLLRGDRRRERNMPRRRKEKHGPLNQKNIYIITYPTEN